MRVSYNLLKEYIRDLKLSPEELIDLFPQLGIEVEEFRYLGEGLEGFVLSGLVEEVKELPDAAGYKVTKVSLGDRKITLVSTAPNVSKNLKVVVALPGTRLGNTVVQKREVKGVQSEGNILSLEELGFPVSSEGVFELPEEFKVGISPLEYLGLKDWTYELYVFPNRPDLMGIIGLAIEISAHIESEIVWPKVGVEEECSDVPDIEIVDAEGCPVYTGRIVKNVIVRESPFDLVKKLSILGQRPINNVVDITNYVMFEFGQPIHAFDREKVEGGIVVRRAKPGEKILCLDGVERTLDPEILVIADHRKPVAVAGVIGGEGSSVTETTKDIIIESAYFDRVRIRKASAMLGVSTESSKRFERGGDPSITEVASRRVAYLVKQMAGGTVCRIHEVKKKHLEQKKINVYFKDLNRIFGKEIDPLFAKRAIDRLGFAVHRKEDCLEVVVPPRRRDIEEWEDVAEEILKIYGYDRIEARTTTCGSFSGRKLKTIDRELKKVLSSAGFLEVKTVEFVDPEELEAFGQSASDFVRIRNPIHSEMSVLRTSLLPGLLRVASINLRRGLDFVKIFEAGKVFKWRGEDNLPEERLFLGICVAGEIPRTWDRTERTIDIYDLLAAFNTIRVKFEPELSLVSEELSEMGLVNGGVIRSREKRIGYLGAVSNKVKKLFDVKAPVFAMELDLTEAKLKDVRYTGIPVFPATSRDISIVLDVTSSISEVVKMAEEVLAPFLEEYRVVDIYTGKPIPEGKKSITIKFVFRAGDRTLTQEEVDQKFYTFLDLVKDRGYEIRGLNG